MPATLKGFAIVGPVSPWDKEHTDEIHLWNAKATFAGTAGEAWAKQCRTSDTLEKSRRTQYWHNLGYRLVEATLTIDNSNLK